MKIIKINYIEYSTLLKIYSLFKVYKIIKNIYSLFKVYKIIKNI